MLNKETIIGKISVVGQYKAVHVAVDTLIKEDGNLISQTRRRYVLHPDMDISEQPQEVKDICNTAWTDEIKSSWNTHLENLEDN